MPRIGWTEREDADGPLAELYAEWSRNNPDRDDLPGILKCFSASPDLLRSIMDLSYRFHFVGTELSRRTKEMIATYVSAWNKCRY